MSAFFELFKHHNVLESLMIMENTSNILLVVIEGKLDDGFFLTLIWYPISQLASVWLS